MMCFMMERDFWKLASSAVASSLLALWSMMKAVGEATQVGSKVRPDAAKPVK
jgi:hypothetical protein